MPAGLLVLACAVSSYSSISGLCTGTVEGLESQLRAANNALDKSKQEHVLALAQKERQVNADKEWEVEEAQRQKREVERERDTLCAEVRYKTFNQIDSSVVHQ